MLVNSHHSDKFTRERKVGGFTQLVEIRSKIFFYFKKPAQGFVDFYGNCMISIKISRQKNVSQPKKWG